MIKKFAAPALALSLAFGAIVAGSEPVEAKKGRGVALGVAAGVVGLGLLGAAASANAGPRYNSHCYTVGGGCYWREGHCFYNRYGDYVCRRGHQVCEPRRTVCE